MKFIVFLTILFWIGYFLFINNADFRQQVTQIVWNQQKTIENVTTKLKEKDKEILLTEEQTKQICESLVDLNQDKYNEIETKFKSLQIESYRLIESEDYDAFKLIFKNKNTDIFWKLSNLYKSIDNESLKCDRNLKFKEFKQKLITKEAYLTNLNYSLNNEQKQIFLIKLKKDF